MSGIYIHIPFCKQACHYCNFHFSTSLLQKEELVASLIKEINASFKFSHTGETIETVYFGGGTPSILTTDDLKKIFEALHKKFSVDPAAEITLEANPDDITNEKLEQWKQMGVNRFSIGIQSFLEDELKWMNRTHSANEALHCIQMVQDAGYTNFSVDLIYGSPLLTNEHWKKNVEIVLKKNVPHISCYALTVESGTALEKLIILHKKQPVDAGKQAEQFLLLMDWMQQEGYEQYEISNFAKPGYRSQHNSSYWQGKNYYGFGPSAHSFDGKSRRWNISNNALYIQFLQKNIIPFEEEILTPTQQLNEYIMTSLRTIEGLDLNLVEKKFGLTFCNKLQTLSSKWQNDKKMEIKNGKIRLTNEGKLFADGIAANMFFGIKPI